MFYINRQPLLTNICSDVYPVCPKLPGSTSHSTNPIPHLPSYDVRSLRGPIPPTTKPHPPSLHVGSSASVVSVNKRPAAYCIQLLDDNDDHDDDDAI